MSGETPKRLDISELQQKINLESRLEGLEREGIHVDTLADAVDTTSTKALSQELRKVHSQTQGKIEHEIKEEPTFAQRNRIIERRRHRNLVSRMLNPR